jgi:hypothetical protein
MTNEAKQQWTVWWFVWAAFQSGIFVIYHFLGSKGGAAAPAGDASVWMAGFLPVAISAVIRWGVLPRVQTVQAALPMFVVGLALAEMACFLGVFVFPAHRQELFALSVAGIFQFMPFFARRYFDTADSG